MTIGKLTNTNVYLNGTTLLGKLESFDLPDIKVKYEDYKALGLLSEMEVPIGLEKMIAKLNFKTFFAKDFAQIAAIYQSQNLIIRGNIEEFTQLGRVEQKGVNIVLNGLFKNFPLGKLAQHEIKDLSVEMAVQAVSVLINNIPIINIDIFSNTFVVNGVDAWIGAKANI